MFYSVLSGELGDHSSQPMTNLSTVKVENEFSLYSGGSIPCLNDESKREWSVYKAL
jgi:hypothetical protein